MAIKEPHSQELRPSPDYRLGGQSAPVGVGSFRYCSASAAAEKQTPLSIGTAVVAKASSSGCSCCDRAREPIWLARTPYPTTPKEWEPLGGGRTPTR
jgi:hypothetical protein